MAESSDPTARRSTGWVGTARPFRPDPPAKTPEIRYPVPLKIGDFAETPAE
jgi:hypothetical protein